MNEPGKLDRKLFRVRVDGKHWATMYGDTAEQVLAEVNIMLGAKAATALIRVTEGED
jgi:hypothetical protein